MMLSFAQQLGMAQKLSALTPEILLTGAAFVVMILGLSKNPGTRRFTAGLSLAALAIAGILAMGTSGPTPPLAQFAKVAICLIGFLLLLVAIDLPDEAGGEPDESKPFDPARTSRGEFFGLFLLSLVGAMLCAGADDLIWLFLALELASLPTYVLVAIGRQNIRAPEAGVKYFFLGALAAALFLYGFALIYAATGSTYLSDIAHHYAEHGFSKLALAGTVLAVIGVGFKLAAFPMHFYAADVYEGAATAVTTFLAFVPKAAGIVTLILLLQTTGWQRGGTHEVLTLVLWSIAVLTMFVGNTLALLQGNVKRVLAYSSIAHSGYMLVGLVSGPGAAGAQAGWVISNGIAAVLFYLVAYGVMTLGAFAVLGVLKRGNEEAETFEDLRGLFHRRPGLAIIMAVCCLSLTGIPPLVGFWGKLFLVGSAISAGYYGLAVLTVLNSAISAYYYLRIFGVCFLQEPGTEVKEAPYATRTWAAVLSAVAVIVLSFFASGLINASVEVSGKATAPAHIPHVLSQPSHP